MGKTNVAKERTSNKYCSECKMRIRGTGHYEGQHHKKKSQGKKL